VTFYQNYQGRLAYPHPTGRHAESHPLSRLAITCSASVALAVLLSPSSAPAQCSADTQNFQTLGLSAGAVDDYHDAPNGGRSTDTQVVEEVASFINYAIYPNPYSSYGPFLTYTVGLTDSAFWDCDGIDGELPNWNHPGTGADDCLMFDRTDSSYTYIAAHGDCSDWNPSNSYQNNTACTSTSQCTNPPSVAIGPGVCIRLPSSGSTPNPNGQCVYAEAKALYLNSNSPSLCFSNILEYSTGNNVRFGESNYSGNWAGAGENGGTNVLFMTNSCGLRPNLEFWQIYNLFGGLQVLGMMMPISPSTSDTEDAPGRGVALGEIISINPFSSIGDGYLSSIEFLDDSGFSGLGASVAWSVGPGADWDTSLITRDWWQATYNNGDNFNGDNMTGIGLCNYDCETFTPVIP
jgi:hypothetical protein